MAKRRSKLPAPDFFINKEIGGYVLCSHVGSGNIGHVFRGTHKKLGREAAVKVLPPEPPSDWFHELSKVFKLERVPGVVPLFDSSAELVGDRSFTYQVWQYVEGTNLRDYLAPERTIEASFLHLLLTTVLEVLQACQDCGVKRHGDLHAGNILVAPSTYKRFDRYGSTALDVYVTDFGMGWTGGKFAPKDDYRGLAEIINLVISRIKRETATSSDRLYVKGIRDIAQKFLLETDAERKRFIWGVLPLVA